MISEHNTRLLVTLPKDLHAELAARAKEEGRSMSSIAKDAVKDALTKSTTTEADMKNNGDVTTKGKKNKKKKGKKRR
jgi:metal-responsive CopG/Arc/MetJ family transcriptional regulator